MNLRTFSLIVVCALAAAPAKATFFDDADKLVGDIVIDLAKRADKVGAYFNLCKPTVSQGAAQIGKQLIDATGKVIDQASQGNLGDAGQGLVDAGGQAINVGKQLVNPNIPTTPIAKLVNEHMEVAKVVACLAAKATAFFVTKKIYRFAFPKPKKESKK